MRLEVIAGMQEANDKAIGKLTAKLDTLTERTIQAMDSINTLGRIAGLHEERLDRLEE